jgi:hypothetical protein
MSKALHRYCEAALAVLNSQFTATKVLKHKGTLGSVREQIIKDFLTAHLPELIAVRAGQIVDSEDNYSQQQDVVLTLKSVPRLPFASGIDLIFQEGVVATIEVKTRLDTDALNGIATNIKSVRELKANIGSSAQMGMNHRWPQHQILTAIVCYEGMDFDALSASLHALDERARPDLVLHLTKGLMVKNHGLLAPQHPPQFDYVIYSEAAAEGFKLFLTFLTEITGTISARGVNWRKYW